MTQKCWSILAIIVICFFASSCSFSTSSKHSSKSSSSSCRSSSKQEESINKTSASYQEEVSALTILYVGSMGTAQNYQRELNQVASAHGIGDWQNTESTFKAIGIGLKRAKISADSISGLSFMEGLNSSPFYPQIIAAYQ